MLNRINFGIKPWSLQICPIVLSLYDELKSILLKFDEDLDDEEINLIVKKRECKKIEI